MEAFSLLFAGNGLGRFETNSRLKEAAPTYISQGQSGRIYRHGPPCLLCVGDFRPRTVRCQYARGQFSSGNPWVHKHLATGRVKFV